MLLRITSALACCLTLGLADANAHFIWIDLASTADGQPQARLYFSETPEPGEPHLIAKIAHTKAWSRDAQDHVTDLTVGKPAGDESAELPLAGAAANGASLEADCDYGVYQRGPSGMLLHYYAKRLGGDWASGEQKLARAPRLALDIVPHRAGDKLKLAVIFQGKPSPGAELVVVDPAGEQQDLKTDEQGEASVNAAAGGRYAVRASHIVPDGSGTRDGKKYAQTLHYCTLLVDVPRSTVSAEEPSAVDALRRAREGRAVWEQFPGFTADVAITDDQETCKGHVTIDASGTVSLDAKPGKLTDWAEEQLNSLVQHRMPDGEVSEGKVVWADEPAGHPLGRKIKLGDAGFQSAYRLKDDVIMEVNRSAGKMRFTISVLEIERNAEQKYLPRAFTMNFFDAESGELKMGLGYWNQWQRVGAFDLPRTILEVSAHAGGTSTRQIEFSHCQLIEKQ